MKINYNFQFGGMEFEQNKNGADRNSDELKVSVDAINVNGNVELSLEEMVEIFKNHRQDITDIREFLKMELPVLIKDTGTAIADAWTALSEADDRSTRMSIERAELRHKAFRSGNTD